MVRPPCSDKLNYKKRNWREENDAKILKYVSSKHGKSEETSLGVKSRCGKSSCRGKWSNNESFSEQEEELIIKLHAAVGSRWAIIAHQLSGRTDNDIKVHWNTKLKKKLSERGIDPVTHKPFSQILADYGKINGLSRVTTTTNSRYIGTMKADLKKVASSFSIPNSKPETSSILSSNNNSSSFISNPLIFFQDENISSINTTNTTNNNSLDLLSQLQAISLVTDQGTHFKSVQLPFNNSSSFNSCYSSFDFSSTYNNNNNAGEIVRSPESSLFSWHDFLLDESTKQVQEQEQEREREFEGIQCGLGSKQSRVDEIGDLETDGDPFQGGSSSSKASMFLEAMLDQENDMFLNFPGLMEDPLY